MRVTTTGGGFLAHCPCTWERWSTMRSVVEKLAREHSATCPHWRERAVEQ